MNKDIQKSIYQLFKKEPFFALLLQEINIRLNTVLPTASVSFDKKMAKFFMDINPSFFSKLNLEGKQAVLLHELLHILHKHISTNRFKIDGDKRIQNIAMDMAINQYIQGLPRGCPNCVNNISRFEPCESKDCPGRGIDVSEWKNKKGNPFPTYQNFEVYCKLIEETKDNINKDVFQLFAGNDGQSLDEHNFESLTEEEKKEVLKEMKAVLERTIEKTVYGKSCVPKFIQDMLVDLEANINGINYKQILLKTIKKSLAMTDREYTWHKPNKRYGYLFKGTKLGKIPNVYFYGDTSGSISHTELNEFLSIVDNFLKVGQKKCFLGLWHTSLYYLNKYKIGTRLTEKNIQSGGTDVTDTLTHIKKKNPDLSIILTDGIFDLPKEKFTNNILWIISKNGSRDKAHLDQLPGKYIFIP